MEFPMRINKYLAHKGYATRKEADELVERGKVLINGVPAVIGQKVAADDVVEVTETNKKSYRYILYYKPRGVITHSPAAHETDIVTRIKADHGITGVAPIGRLDKDSEGLILLSNDGRITERILSPDAAHEKEYEVTVDKKVQGIFLRKMETGVNIEGYVTKPAIAEKVPGREDTFTIVLTEGKKHQVRRMCAALGYQVLKLKRVRIMNLTRSAMPSGGYRELKGNELRTFLDLLGLK